MKGGGGKKERKKRKKPKGNTEVVKNTNRKSKRGTK